MTNEIDLLPYLERWLASWKMIIGASFAFGVLVLLLSFAWPATYEATALVSVTEAQERVEFDPRFAAYEQPVPRPAEAYPEIAASDTLLIALLDSFGDSLTRIRNLEQLRRSVSADSGADPSLIVFTLRAHDPIVAADGVNLWADLFIEHANRLFGDNDEAQTALYEDKVTQADVALNSAEEALISFQAGNRITILSNELDSLRQHQADFLAQQRAIGYLQTDVTLLRNQLADTDQHTQPSFADQLTLLNLQIEVFDARASVPLQLQITSDDALVVEDRRAQLDVVTALSEQLIAKSAEIDRQLVTLEPQILTLQSELQQLETTLDRLTRQRDIARETFTILNRKVEEQTLSSLDSTGGVLLASRAAPVDDPVTPRKALNAVAATILAFVASSAYVLHREWWAQIQQQRQQ